ALWPGSALRTLGRARRSRVLGALAVRLSCQAAGFVRRDRLTVPCHGTPPQASHARQRASCAATGAVVQTTALFSSSHARQRASCAATQTPALCQHALLYPSHARQRASYAATFRGAVSRPSQRAPHTRGSGLRTLRLFGAQSAAPVSGALSCQAAGFVRCDVSASWMYHARRRASCAATSGRRCPTSYARRRAWYAATTARTEQRA